MTSTTTDLPTSPLDATGEDDLDPDAVGVTPEDDGTPDLAPDPQGKKLFDPAQFDSPALRLDQVDGEDVQKIAAKFSGTVWLDRSNPDHVTLIRDLRLGQTVTLQVEALVGPPIPGSTTNREGDLDVLSLSRKFDVQTLYKLTPEEL